MNLALKNCPYCGEVVETTNRVCRYCKEEIEDNILSTTDARSTHLEHSEGVAFGKAQAISAKNNTGIINQAKQIIYNICLPPDANPDILSDILIPNTLGRASRMILQYMPNRGLQDNEFNAAISKWKDKYTYRRPFIFLIQGDYHQSVDWYETRLKRYTLPGFADSKNIISYDPWLLKITDPSEFRQSYLNNLAGQMAKESKVIKELVENFGLISKEHIHTVLEDNGHSRVIISSFIDPVPELWSNNFDPIGHILDLWKNWPDLKGRHEPLVVCLFVRYHRFYSPLYWFFKHAIANRRLKKRLHLLNQLQTSESSWLDKYPCKILPPLDNIDWSEVMEWARNLERYVLDKKQKSEFIKRYPPEELIQALEEQIFPLMSRGQKMPLKFLAVRLQTILEQIP